MSYAIETVDLIVDRELTVMKRQKPLGNDARHYRSIMNLASNSAVITAHPYVQLLSHATAIQVFLILTDDVAATTVRTLEDKLVRKRVKVNCGAVRVYS